MGYYLDLGKRAVVFAVAVILALSYGATDGLVCGIALFGSARVSGVIHFLTSF
jgi:hypothetical protein